ncbi:Cro/Cl family transcriptional regulator [Mycobacteroides chelonae]|uniref:Cro/Cl family transcriptional regulator n=1 Tax=Mycobacteroides chelonae TaxID=1774 RepID=UPI0008A96FB1|nr:Cro/Cl family transcriptional regulator [Mycobacteroides chelonae]OHU29071.1 Cro/Cl family transcriptional regulator [Mycobacteroides chelonae]
MSYGLEWHPQGVLNTLAAKDIETVAELARFLGIGSSTVYDAFDRNWAGRATPTLIDAMCQKFGIPMSQIVVEPMTKARPKQVRTRRAVNVG